MEPLIIHTGVAAPLLRDNIDTDAIIPSREMKRVSKKGLGEGLFAGWRYTLPGGREPNPDFVLNQAPFSDATILLAGQNFGCGSSREHAVWALKEYGIRVIIAHSFGTIFHGNCVRNGILAITLAPIEIETIAKYAEPNPAEHTVRVDLPAQRVTLTANRSPAFSFHISAGDKAMLLEGLDGIALTMKEASAIDAFEEADRKRRPWVYLDSPGPATA